MSLCKYPCVRDIKDIHAVYKDDNQWRISIWNFTDGQHMKLCVGTSFNLNKDADKDNAYRVIFRATKESKHTRKFEERFINDLESLYDEILNHHIYEDLLDVDRCKIQVINIENNQPMNLTFVGSDNTDHIVHYSLDYVDPEFHKLRRNFRMWRIQASWYLKKWFNKICPHHD